MKTSTRGNEADGRRVVQWAGAVARAAFAAFALIAVCLSNMARAAIPESERQALIDIYNTTGGDNWYFNEGWLGAAGTECSWQSVGTGPHGLISSAFVDCNEDETHVVNIYLNRNNLAGVLPDISAFTQLRWFQAIENKLTGSLPPAEEIPSTLKLLMLSSNQLYGSIPDYSSRPSLYYLQLDSNNLSGALPSLGQYLAFIAGKNQLTGSMPVPMGRSDMTVFEVGGNRIEGSIPDLSGFIRLYNFSVNDNILTGVIPNLSHNTSLSVFSVSGNVLTGVIPDLSNNPSLSVFDVSNNRLEGAVPSFSNNSLAARILVARNDLSGEMPSITHLSHLVDIDVSRNQLSGEIPSIEGMESLTSFNASFNKFSGPSPRFSNSPLLGAIYLGHNELSGEFTPFGEGLDSLGYFDISYNELTGSFPDLSGVPALTRVVISHNQFRGPIPSLAALPIANLWAGYNAFTGDPPDLPPRWSVGDSRLCPNNLNPVPSADWDAATGIAPWYLDCADGLIFRTSFEDFEDQQ